MNATIAATPLAAAETKSSGFWAKAYSAFGALLMVEILAQFFFIAAAIIPVSGAAGSNDNEKALYAVWKNTFDSLLGLHVLNGTFLIPVTIILLVLLSFAARHPWKTTFQTLGLLGLMVVQFLLGIIGAGNGGGNSGIAVVGGLHGLNAILIISLAFLLTRKRWAF